MSKKSTQKGSGVFARDMKLKEQAEILNPVLVYSLTKTGKKKYRLTGVSAAGTSLSVFVSQDVASRFGPGKKVEPKARASRKSCEEKFEECKAKAPAKRGRKPAASSEETE